MFASMSTPPGISPTPAEQIRARIAYLLLAIFAGTVALILVVGAGDIREVGAAIIAAEAGLLGTVLRSYFAGGQRQDD